MAVVIEKFDDLTLVESGLGLTVHHGLSVDVSSLTGRDDFDRIDGFFDDLGSAALSGKLYTSSGATMIVSSDTWRIIQGWADAREAA